MAHGRAPGSVISHCVQILTRRPAKFIGVLVSFFSSRGHGNLVIHQKLMAVLNKANLPTRNRGEAEERFETLRDHIGVELGGRTVKLGE